jgi:hypothetical protein
MNPAATAARPGSPATPIANDPAIAMMRATMLLRSEPRCRNVEHDQHVEWAVTYAPR